MLVNTNSASNSQFQCFFTKNADLRYMLQTVAFPSVTLPPIEQFVPALEIPLNADRALFEPMQLGFIVDDSFDNYKYFYDWLLRIVETDDSHITEETDIVLIIHNRQNVPVKRITFRHAMMSGIGGLEMATNGDESIMILPVTFDFSYFDIEEII